MLLLIATHVNKDKFIIRSYIRIISPDTSLVRG